MTTLPPDRKPMINLTGHLSSLKSSLTPDCKLFEPMPPLYISRPRSEPSSAMWRLFLAFLALFGAILCYYFTL